MKPASLGRRLVGGYLVFEAGSLVLFWVCYAASPTFRGWFVPDALASVVDAFSLPDLALLLPLAIGGAHSVFKGSRSMQAWIWMHLGCAAYATLWSAAAAWINPAFIMSFLMMAPMLGASLLVVLLLRSEVSP